MLWLLLLLYPLPSSSIEIVSSSGEDLGPPLYSNLACWSQMIWW